MSVRGGNSPVEAVIGSDRDAGRIVTAMRAGTSVLVAGSLGSGKTHLLRSVAMELDRVGLEPVVLRASPKLAGVAHGALRDCPDRRTMLLREDDTTALEHPVVVVADDAQSLDPETADTLARAIHRQRAVALLGVETPRARAVAPREATSAASTFVDLWLHGVAERVDLHELVPGDAERLLDHFSGADRFDAVTRARIIGLADGSRILLRELAAHASAALTAGTDPLESLREIRRHSRLGDALHAHVGELGEAEQLGLALLGRLSGIAYADATRFLTSSVIDGLLSARLVYEDGSVRRRLYANPALASESEQQLPSRALDDAIERAAGRMLEASGTWWSRPLAVAIAERWHGSPVPGLSPAEAPLPLRVRVATDAARNANDAGDPMQAIAYTTLVTDGETAEPALVLEREHARGTVSLIGHVPSSVDASSLDGSSLRRYLRLREHVAAGIRPADLAASLGATFASDERTTAELDFATSECAALDLDWPEAEAAARRVLARPGGDASTRLRATLVCTFSRVYDGDWSGAAGFLDRANHLLHERTVPADLSTTDRMLALCTELMVSQSAGLDAVRATERLRDETIRAAREESRAAIVLAGLGAALVHARSGNAAGAIAEADAAAHRSSNLTLGPLVAVMQLSIARSLSLLGRTVEARALQRRAADAAIRSAPFLEHSHALTESCLRAAEGATEDALEPAEEAAMLSDRPGTRLLHLRDLYQLTALGAADDVMLHKMRRIADATDLPAAHVLTERAAAVLRGRKSMTRRTPIERLRLGAPWSGAGAATDASAAVGEGVRVTGGFPRARDALAIQSSANASLGLTRREREIAHLVAEGLSNRDIAERLYLSVRTVESHVYQARAKMGARSRHELGRMVGRRQDDRGDGTGGRR